MKTLEENVDLAVWDSVVPLRFVLAPEELLSGNIPPPMYVLLRRNSYLSFVDQRICKHFQEFSLPPGEEANVWYSLNDGTPIKWQLPLGVLYDLHCLCQNQDGEIEETLELVVRLRNFPMNELIKFGRPGEDTDLKRYFTNQLKQGTFLKDGNVSKMNNLSMADSLNIWNGLRNGQRDLFLKTSLLLKVDCPKHIPIRVCQPQKPIIQELVPPQDNSGQQLTLGSYLSALFVSGRNSEAEFERNDSVIDPNDLMVFIQGISPSFESSLVWLSCHLSHPDSFLYIVVKQNVTSS